MFRTIVILGILLVVAFMAGWFTIQRDDNETTIRFNRDEIRADTRKAIAKGRELINQNVEEPSGQEQLFDGQLFGEPQQATRTIPAWDMIPTGDASGQQY